MGSHLLPLHRPALLALAVTVGLTGGAACADEDVGSRVYQKVLKSIVWIHSPRDQGRVATGSGTLIDRKHRLILTNYHVVGDNNDARVLFPSYRDGKLIAEREYYAQRVKSNGIRGKVIARDPRRDLAILQLNDLPEGVEQMPLAPQSVSPGQTVHSVGNPGGSGALWVYTPGKVRQVYFKKWKTELDGRVVNFEAQVVETDSPTNPGDSGGPLVNDQAQLVGVTQGGDLKARLISLFIDVCEVKLLLKTREVRAVLGSDQLVPPRPATALVKDGGGFFSADVVKKATEEIQELAKKYGRDLIIETYASVPAEDRDKVKEMNRQERSEYFEKWAIKRARDEAVNGILILVCREPSHLQVEVSRRFQSMFDRKERDKLIELLLKHFREKKYDDGLKEAIQFVREKLAESPRP